MPLIDSSADDGCIEEAAVCGMCEAVVSQRALFLKRLRGDALVCIGRCASSSAKTTDFQNGRLTMRERAVGWYATHLARISRTVCAGRQLMGVPKKRWLQQETVARSKDKRLTPLSALAMPLPAALWRLVADFALSPCTFLVYSASVTYVPRSALTDVLHDLCPESRNMWPIPRGGLDRLSHSTLRCPWISSGFVCPYLTFADKSYGQDVYHLTQGRLADVRLLRLMCRRIASCISDTAAHHATRRMEHVHSHVLQVQRARRKSAFVDYRRAIAMRQPFFLPAQLLGEPMRIRFGHSWQLPAYLNAPKLVFVVVAHISDTCWECAVLREDEFAHCLLHVHTSAAEYRNAAAATTEARPIRTRMARACEDMGKASGRRSVHLKATPYGDGYRVRVYYVRVVPNIGARPGSTLVGLRFMCLPRMFHLYPAYKKTTADWKHKTQVMPKPPCALSWQNIDPPELFLD